ncbi:MAG: hypothetical protein QNK37_22070 [Acidobacteriota bacterium]|nr:hypothetical protein [Acidobacteriota bacterium]
MKFRSPFLKAPPKNVKENRTEIMQKRVVLVTLLFVFLGLPTLSVAMNWMPEDGLGYGLYWLHDHVFLTIKGWTYHRFQPAGSIWWTMALLFFLTWLVFFLVDESMILSPHRDLAVFALRRPRFHGPLLRSARWLARRKLSPRLLIEAVEYERTAVLDALIRKQVDKAELQRLGGLTLLQIRLLTLPGSRPAEYLQAACVWQSSYLLLRNRLKNRPPWFVELSKVPASLAVLLMASPDPGEWRTVLNQGRPRLLDGGDLILDLLLTAALDDHATAEKLLGETLALRPPAERRRVITKHLHVACTNRRTYLETQRRLLENIALGVRVPVEPEMPFGSVQPALLSYLGRLTLNTAMDLADLIDRPAPALSMMDTLETLSLTISLFDEHEEEASTLEVLLDRFEAFVGDIPTARDFYRCSRLTEASQRKRRKAWSDSAVARDDLLGPDDFKLSAARTRSLQHAAGPAYDQAREVS